MRVRAAADLGATAGRSRRRTAAAIGASAALALATAVLSLGTGPVPIPPDRVLAVLFGAADPAGPARDAVVVLDVRLPRTVLAALVGAATAVAGAVMQGLFRNPLADPGIIGISSGAALAAALWIVLGTSAASALLGDLGNLGLPVSAFLGSLAAAAAIQAIASRGGRVSVVAMLLAGIAVTGFAGALVGFLVFLSSDQQLREFTFWTLGSVGGATWPKIALALPFTGALLVLAPLLARRLDAIALGEADAFYAGVDVEQVKRLAVLGVAAGVGASVAVAGVIGFFGLIVPHLVRLVFGPGHRLLLPVAAFAGAALLVLADMTARTVAAPAELPLGIVTAAIGAPLMLWLLLHRFREFAG